MVNSMVDSVSVASGVVSPVSEQVEGMVSAFNEIHQGLLNNGLAERVEQEKENNIVGAMSSMIDKGFSVGNVDFKSLFNKALNAKTEKMEKQVKEQKAADDARSDDIGFADDVMSRFAYSYSQDAHKLPTLNAEKLAVIGAAANHYHSEATNEHKALIRDFFNACAAYVDRTVTGSAERTLEQGVFRAYNLMAPVIPAQS